LQEMCHGLWELFWNVAINQFETSF
jgi:hypothetical protein